MAHGGKPVACPALTELLCLMALPSMMVNGALISGTFGVMGQEPTKRGEVRAGDMLLFGCGFATASGYVIEEKGKKVAIIETL